MLANFAEKNYKILIFWIEGNKHNAESRRYGFHYSLDSW